MDRDGRGSHGGASHAARVGAARRAGPGGVAPAHRRPGLVLVVAVGGALGTVARYGLSSAVPATGGAGGALPAATLTANVLGALLLGLLLEVLVRAGAEGRVRRAVRLGLGTGVLGGFTTFSSLALEVHALLAGGRAVVALAYGLGSVVLGVAACTLGVVAGTAVRRRRAGRPRGQASAPVPPRAAPGE